MIQLNLFSGYAGDLHNRLTDCTHTSHTHTQSTLMNASTYTYTSCSYPTFSRLERGAHFACSVAGKRPNSCSQMRAIMKVLTMCFVHCAACRRGSGCRMPCNLSPPLRDPIYLLPFRVKHREQRNQTMAKGAHTQIHSQIREIQIVLQNQTHSSITKLTDEAEGVEGACEKMDSDLHFLDKVLRNSQNRKL